MQPGYKAHLEYDTYPDDPKKIKWCSLCLYCWDKDGELVCTNRPILSILWNGPDRVSQYGTCDNCVNKYSEEAKNLQRSNFVNKLLEINGIIQR